MLTLNGFSAWITIEGVGVGAVGKEAKEYDVQVKHISGLPSEISCFITSEVGQVRCISDTKPIQKG